jgi:hypothetical protein
VNVFIYQKRENHGETVEHVENGGEMGKVVANDGAD